MIYSSVPSLGVNNLKLPVFKYAYIIGNNLSFDIKGQITREKAK